MSGVTSGNRWCRGGPTEKRISWVCTKADDQTTQEACADKLQDGVAAETTFGTGGISGCHELTCNGGMFFSKYRQSYSIGDCELAKKCLTKLFEGDISCLDAYLWYIATDGWDGCSCE